MSIQQQIASRIEQFMPDLRKQVRVQIMKQLVRTNRQILQQKTNEIRQLYTQKLKQRAQQIKNSINANLSSLNNQITAMNLEIVHLKTKKLTQLEKNQIIQDTVQQITSDPQMLQQIRSKLQPKVQQHVFEQLETKLQSELEDFQATQQRQYQANRVQWDRERCLYWEAESQRQIEVLAEEHKELECKKNLIEQSLLTRKAERDALIRQQNNLIQLNNQISMLKTQIKQLS